MKKFQGKIYYTVVLQFRKTKSITDKYVLIVYLFYIWLVFGFLKLLTIK